MQWEVIDARLRRAQHAGADRRPQAGDLRLPRRRHRDLPPGRGRPPASAAHPRHQLAQRPAAGRRLSRWCSAAPRSATRTSWSATVERPPPGQPAGRRAVRRPVPAAGRAAASTFGVAAPADHPHGRPARPHRRATSPPTSAGCSPPARRTTDGRVRAGDVAVIVEAHKDARACRDALAAAGVPAVYTGDTDVFASQAAPGLAVPAGGVRAAAPLRAGAGRGDHDVLRRDRRQPARRRRRPDRPGRPRRCAAWADHAPRPRRGRGVRGRAGRRDGRSGCWPGAAASAT